MMKKLRQIISLVLVLVMFFDYGAVSASYERASYAVTAVAGLEELIQSAGDLEEIQGEEADAAEAPDLAELPEQPEDAQPGEAPEDAQQSEDPDALLQAERVSPLTSLLNQVSRLSAPYRDDGYIHIYNYYQLSLIGTGLPVEAEDVFHGYADNAEADAPEAPDWGEEPEQPAQAEQPEQPAQVEQPEQPVEAEQPEQPAQVQQPEQPAEAEQPEQPAEVEEPEQPAEVEQPEQPAEPEQPEQPTEPDEPEQIAAPEASALPEVPEQIGETLLTQALGRALSRVLVRDTAAPQRAVVATLASAVAEVTGEDAAPQELAEEDAPAELQGEAQPETDPDPMTDPAQTAAEPALPVAAGESAPDDSDTLPTDAEPAPDAVPAQDSEEPEAPAATGTSPTESDADADTYYNNDENNEEPAPAAEPAEPEEIAEPEDGEAAPPAAQPELIDDPDVVDSPETGDLSQQPDEPVNEPTDSPDEGSALTESKYYYYPNGELVRYTSDANYYLECDIELPSENCWTLPEDFTGSFTGRASDEDEAPIYDSETDTIYIYNPLQLLELHNESREEDPVMSGDVNVFTFGTGMLVFTDGSQGDAALSDDLDGVLTYSARRSYMLRSNFNPSLLNAGGLRAAAVDTLRSGRDYTGQVTRTINGTEYILIGDRQQLKAIASGDAPEVYGPIYRIPQRLTIGGWVDNGDEEIYYPGDADLISGATVGNLGSESPYGSGVENAPLYDGNVRSLVNLRGVYQALGRDISILGTDYYYYTKNADGTRSTSGTGKTYSQDGKYIIFRDIDLNDEAWTPLMLTGEMYGIKPGTKTTSIVYVNDENPMRVLTAAEYTAAGSPAGYTEQEREAHISEIAPLLGSTGTLTAAQEENLVDERQVAISNVNVVPSKRTNLTGDDCVNLEVHTGVGFFGTIGNVEGLYQQASSGQTFLPAIVKNIMLDHVVVKNDAVYCYDAQGESLLSVLTELLGSLLDTLLNGVLNALINASFEGFTGGGSIKLNLTDLLDTRGSDPVGLSTGAFAGLVSGSAVVEYCGVSCASVTTAETLYEKGADHQIGLNTESGMLIVGKGGFVGTVTGNSVYAYELLGALTDILGVVGNLLNGNLLGLHIPVVGDVLGLLGLGDLIPLLTENILKLGLFAPIDYKIPVIRNCTADRITLSNSDEVKFGVGGFAGNVVGAALEECTLSNSDYLVVQAEKFGGGFVGILRDGIVTSLLSGLGVTVDVGRLPRSNGELISCTIADSDIVVRGTEALGGFVGQMCNSYAFNSTADEKCKLVVDSYQKGKYRAHDEQNYVGGFTGCATVGSFTSAGSYTKTDPDLLKSVTGLLTQLLGSGNSGALLDLASVTPSAIMGCQLLGSVEVRTNGSYAGGFVGRGDGVHITDSTESNMRELQKYKRAENTPPAIPPRCNVLWNLVDVHADKSYVGGIGGELGVASGAGLLGDTVGVGAYIPFKLEHMTVRGISLSDYRGVYYSITRSKDECATMTEAHHDKYSPYATVQNAYLAKPAHNEDGYYVNAGEDYVGGGIGLSRGGDAVDVALERLISVKGRNYVGGFVGATGPGELVGGGGVNVQLLGISLASVDNLLSLGKGIRSSFLRVTVKGSAEGFTVEETGIKSDPAEAAFVAGGFAGTANSVEVNDCHVLNLRYVKANLQDGVAGGFVGTSTIGGLLSAVDGDGNALLQGLQLSNLLDVAPYMVPKFNGDHVYYVNHGYVEGWCAGGFAGDFQSGFVNKETLEDGDGNRYKAGSDGNGSYYAYHDTGFVEADNTTIYGLITDCGCNQPDTHNHIHDGDCTCYCCASGRGAYRYGIPENPWSVYNIGYVRGGKYAGGWGGYVHSGALASAGEGGLSLFGLAGVSLNGLLSLFDSYVPMIMYAGVNSGSNTHIRSEAEEDVWVDGFSVFAADDYATTHDENPLNDTLPATAGYAGGYIGHGSGIQVSYCDVNHLKRGTIKPPDYLEAVDGSAYMEDENFHFKTGSILATYTVNPLLMEYAVAGAYYAGGYIGHMDVDSAASAADGLKLLGNAIQLTNLLSALNVVVSTVEHSDVFGAPGGFNIIASPRINAPRGNFGKQYDATEYTAGEPHAADIGADKNGEGVAYAGGFVAKLSGGHLQDSNVHKFEYIVGEVAAGGYVGEMEPGALANALGGAGVLDRVVNVSNLLSLAQDFVPTIRNSQTTCVPCGGAVRAESPSDRGEHTGANIQEGTVSRGMAGGYVGHMIGGQIWGFDDQNWRSQSMDKSLQKYGQRVAVDGDGKDIKVEVYIGYDGNGRQLVDADGNPKYVYKFANSASYATGGDLVSPLLDYYSSKDYFTVEKNDVDGTISYSTYTILPQSDNTTVNNQPSKVSDEEIWMVYDTAAEKVDVPNNHSYGTKSIYLRGAITGEPQRQCAAIRIRSVYGREHAGGYCGRMECGSTAQTGSLSALGALVDASNLLSALEVTYSTIRFGYVNGPMRGGDDEYASDKSYKNPYEIRESVFERAFEPLDAKTFIDWYKYVGQYGGLNFYGLPGDIGDWDPTQVQAWIEQYIYAMNVRAGRGSWSEEHDDPQTPVDAYEVFSGTSLSLSGTAGGFIGSMWSGSICDSESVDVRNVLAMRASGGFVGEMLTKGLANFGTVSLLGGLIPLNVGSLLSVGEVLVPSIARSGVSGYQRGLTVIANGDKDHRNLTVLGNAGGFVGQSYGGQIGLPDEDAVRTTGVDSQDIDDIYRQNHPYHPLDKSRFDETAEPLTSVRENRGTNSDPKYFDITPGATIWVNNLLTVRGTCGVGGFAGLSSAASVLSADTDQTSDGLIQGLLDNLVGTPSTLLTTLEATQATIKNTVVNALPRDERLNDDTADSHLYDDYGIVIDGRYNDGGADAYAPYVGGFAGTLEATVVGQRNKDYDKNVINKVRSVTGGEYVGGFFGLADVGSVANVGGGGGVSVLSLIQAGNINLLDAFRTYIYHSEVNGVEDGMRVFAMDKVLYACQGKDYLFSGAAGGFGGWMNNGTIEHSGVTNLNYVQAENYAGGFVGYIGKNRLVDASGTNIDLGKLTGALGSIPILGTVLGPVGDILKGITDTGLNLGALNVIGATVSDCYVSGYGKPVTNDGFQVRTLNVQKAVSRGNAGTSEKQVTAACAAGFIGYGDITQIENCTVTRLKKVESKQIAGGFLGRGTRASVLEAEVDNGLVKALLAVVGLLIFRVLHLDDLTNLNLIDLSGFDYLGLRLAADGDLLMLNLLGLRIGVSLGRTDGENQNHLLVTIGTATIDATFNDDGTLNQDSALNINLFEGNRTSVKHCSVSGVIDGYDVLGDGYVEEDSDGDGLDTEDDGTRLNNVWGYAGGFVGYHESSYFSNNEMLYCDVVAGSKNTRTFYDAGTVTSWGKVGPFTGGYNINPNVNGSSGKGQIGYFEGKGAYQNNDNKNLYHIYRSVLPQYNAATLVGGTLEAQADKLLPEYLRFNVQHRASSSVYTDGTAPYHGVYEFSQAQSAASGKTPYLQDATYTGTSADLDAYISEGKALLMLGVIQKENTPHKVVEPSDLNDPCEDIELTLIKQWDFGSKDESAWEHSITYKVYQIISHDAERELLVDGNTANLDGAIQVGEYTLTMEDDTVAIGLDQIKQLWRKHVTSPNMTAQLSGFRYFGTDGDLPQPANYSGWTNRVFQSTSTDPNSATLKKDKDGAPVPVAGTPGQIPLYFKTTDATRFVVGETVQLYYKDGDDYYPAYSFRLNDDTNKLDYPADKFRDKANQDTETINGQICQVYQVTGEGGAPTGETLYIAQDDSGKLTHLVRYVYTDPNPGDDLSALKLTFDFDRNGALTDASETKTDLGGTETTSTIGTVAKDNETYTSTGATTTDRAFQISYNPHLAILQFDYDIARDGNDGVVREETYTNGETFGYDENNELKRYAYRDYSNFSGGPGAFLIVFDEARNGQEVTLDAGAYNGLYSGSKYVATYTDDRVVVQGTSSDATDNKRFVVVYTKDDGHIQLYYPREALAGAKQAYVLEAKDAAGSATNDSAKAYIYGMDAEGKLLYFEYYNKDNGNNGFLAELNTETGLLTSVTDTADTSATVSLSNGSKSFEAGGYRYTVDYNPATREIRVYYVDASEKVTVGSVSYDVYYIYEYPVEDGFTDKLWMDEQGRLLKFTRTDANDPNNVYALECTFDPTTGEVATARQLLNGNSDETLTPVPKTNTVTVNGVTTSTTTYWLMKDRVVDDNGTVTNEGTAVGIVRLEGGNLLVDYRTEGLKTGNGIVYSDSVTDAKGGTHTFYYNAAGDLVNYKLVDADGQTLNVTDIPAKLGNVTSNDGHTVDHVLVQNASDNTTTYGNPAKRYYLKYEESRKSLKGDSANQGQYLDPSNPDNWTESDVRKFTISYDLPDKYPTVFQYKPSTDNHDMAFFDADGNLTKYIYEIPGSQYGTSNNRKTKAMKITFNTATGAVTGVEMTYLDTNGKEVAKGTGGGTDNNATYNSAENLLTFSYRPFILLRSRYFSVDYDKNTRKLTISEKDKDASAPYDQLPYWYSVSEPEKIDDGAGNEINNPNAGYSYVFGYNAQKELQYLRIEKEKSVGSADTATFHIDNDGNMIQDTNGIGDSFRITYDPEKDELKIERFNEDTGVSFVNSTNNPLGSSDTTLEYLYHTTGGTNPSEQTLGFDSNGKLRYYWFSDVAALVYTTTLGFTLSENGNFGNDTENSRNLKRTEYSNNLSNGYWAYDSGGLQNKRIPVKYKISGAVERSWSFDYSNINLTPAETTFYLSDVPTAYTFPSQFQHDLVRVLPRMDITHTVPLKYEPDYEYTLSLPKADKERYLKAPDAEHTHKLAELLNLPDYVAQKARIYYSYAVAEVVPDGYVRTAFDADDATATVSMTNKAIQYKIVIDKFQDGDNTQKLAGAEFVLYRYPTTAELMSGDGLALSDYRFENRLTGVEVTGRDRLLTVTADMAQFQISPVENGAYYTFATNGNYLLSTASGLDLASGSGTDASAQWALTASGTGWVFQNRDTGNYLVCDGANFLQGDGDAATVQLWGTDGKRIETLPANAATTGILYSADDGIAMGTTLVQAQTIGGVTMESATGSHEYRIKYGSGTYIAVQESTSVDENGKTVTSYALISRNAPVTTEDDLSDSWLVTAWGEGWVLRDTKFDRYLTVENGALAITSTPQLVELIRDGGENQTSSLDADETTHYGLRGSDGTTLPSGSGADVLIPSSVNGTGASLNGGLNDSDAYSLTVIQSGAGRYRFRLHDKYLAVLSDSSLGFVADGTQDDSLWQLEPKNDDKWVIRSVKKPGMAIRFHDGFALQRYDKDDEAFLLTLFGGTGTPLELLRHTPGNGTHLAIFHALESDTAMYYVAETDSATSSSTVKVAQVLRVYKPSSTAPTPWEVRGITVHASDSAMNLDILARGLSTLKVQPAGQADGFHWYYLTLTTGEYLAASTDGKKPEFVDSSSDAAMWRFEKTGSNSAANWLIYNRQLPDKALQYRDGFVLADYDRTAEGFALRLYKYASGDTLTRLNASPQDDDRIVILHAYKPVKDETQKVSYTPQLNKAGVVITDIKGFADFRYLDEGVYYVKEIKAPTDYYPLTDPIKVTVRPPSNLSELDLGEDGLFQFVVPIDNVPKTSLPATGGSGAGTLFPVALSLILLGGAYLLYASLRRERRRTEEG